MKPDFDNDEKEFVRELDGSLANVRAAAGACPHPDLVMAVAAGVESAGREQILQHLNACPLCQQLTRDLSEYEYPGVSAEEDRRIRARWEKQGFSTKEPRRSRMWQPLALGTAAALILIAIALVYTMRKTAPTVTTGVNAEKAAPTPPPPAPPAKTRTAFVLGKAAVKVPAAAVLTLRSGSEDARAFLNEFAAALEPYRSDNFAEAARRLEPLSKKYPQSAEVNFYLGVSRLFLNQTTEALESLNASRRLADETLRDDVSWYLALALDLGGRTDDTRREIGTLCSRAGDYQRQACAAQEELK